MFHIRYAKWPVMTDKRVYSYVFSLTWNYFFQIPYWPIIIDHGRRLDREDSLRLQRDYRDSTRETQPDTAVTRQRINQRETSFQRLNTGSEGPDREQRES